MRVHSVKYILNANVRKCVSTFPIVCVRERERCNVYVWLKCVGVDAARPPGQSMEHPSHPLVSAYTYPTAYFLPSPYLFPSLLHATLFKNFISIFNSFFYFFRANLKKMQLHISLSIHNKISLKN